MPNSCQLSRVASEFPNSVDNREIVIIAANQWQFYLFILRTSSETLLAR